ncbi:hypothetical protein ACRS6B_03550 [Nocardia asteroides]
MSRCSPDDVLCSALDLLIEVKYARRASDFKDIEKEILEDHSAYLTDNAPYKKLLVFIYDESASVQEHGTTRNALLKPLRRVARLVSGLSTPDRPEHHFRYDPAKSDAYVATTLAWLGDPAAESYARHVLADLAGAASVRPRRVASANLDLGLALVAADKPDEAADVALTAVISGRLVPSNYWRVSEVVSGIEGHGSPDAAMVREAFRDTYARLSVTTP